MCPDVEQTISLCYPVLSAMVSLRFPFSFHGPNKPFTRSGSSSSYPSPSLAFSVGVVFGLGAGLAISTTAGRLGDHLLPIRNLFDASSRQLSPLWGSLSLTTGVANLENSVVDSRTGAEFPPVLDGSRKLLGIGLRRKNIIGIKNINVYAFGECIFPPRLLVFHVALLIAEYAHNSDLLDHFAATNMQTVVVKSFYVVKLRMRINWNDEGCYGTGCTRDDRIFSA